MDDFLGLFNEIVEAPSYAFYVNDGKQYMLKSVRHRAQDFGKVQPSYSGLAPFKKEQYWPPLSLPASDSRGITIDRDGEVPLLFVPIGDCLGLVRIGPFMGKLSKKHREHLSELSAWIGHSLESLVASERLKNDSQVVIASGRALQKVSQIALDSRVTIDLLIRLGVQTLGASASCWFGSAASGNNVIVEAGVEHGVIREMTQDVALAGLLDRLAGAHDCAVVKRGEEAFYLLPPYMAGMPMDALAVIRLDQTNFLLFWVENPSYGNAADSVGLDTLKLIRGDLLQMVSQQASLLQLSGTYTSILKTLARLLDNLSPYTVGYSEQMSLYSVVIAKELGLEEHVIRDTALAAYLSNIGIFGISTELYQKEGKYSEKEFEMMKLHSEVGASLVRVTTGNERVSSFIMHHHERMDGKGYPGGLRGDHIPVGARIIAVVQTFLAQINGRKYRAPLPFHKALDTLRAAAGTQLDPVIVQAFVEWFRRKQSSPERENRSIGSCWEMCCAPSSICEHCPVYHRQDANCWEVEGNSCSAHGKSCETCFVRTEYVHRYEMAGKRS